MAGASLRNADLSLIDIDGKDFHILDWNQIEDFRGINFANANINNVDFWKGRLEGANFQAANFNRVNFLGANLHGTNFKEVKGLTSESFLNSNDLSVPIN